MLLRFDRDCLFYEHEIFHGFLKLFQFFVYLYMLARTSGEFIAAVSFLLETVH